MRIRGKIALAALLLYLWAVPALLFPTTEGPSFDKAIQAFEEFVVEQMALDRAPGLSAGFMKDDYVWVRGFGYADIENMTPAKPESSYRMASITKTMTAVAVLQLVEEGKIDLDKEVQAYVPHFPRKKWPVTVRQLLGHLGGISHYRDYDVEGRIKEPKNTKEALAIFQDFDLVAEPGTRYNYSSYGYNLLGAVVEGASGQPYGDRIKKRIFEPLGMENSRLDNPLDIIPNRVRGYQIVNGRIKNSEYVDISSRFAGGGTRSTVIDLLKFAGGIISGKLLREKTTRMMFSSMAMHNGYFTGYGMGWMVNPWKGHFHVGHGGSQPETRTHLLILPVENLAVAVASNLEGVNLSPYVKRLAELVLDLDLDSAAYTPDRAKQAVYNACQETFSYGQSFFDWNGYHLSRAERDLREAFAYFNNYVNETALERDYEGTMKKILAGIHQATDQAFTKVGSFMAWTLHEALGGETLQRYHQNGPIAFFSDYIRVSARNPAHEKAFRFPKEFADQIFTWENDWKASYTDSVRDLFITPNTDFEEVGMKLKKTFTGASIYPDFTIDFSQAAQRFLEEKEDEKAIHVLNLSLSLYPQSPLAHASLASALIWKGDIQASRKYYRDAYNLDPLHPQLGSERLLGLGIRLARSGKVKEALALAHMAVEFHPLEARLYADLGDFYLQSGERDKALENYKKALELDPSLDAVKARIRELEKKK